MSNKDVPAKPKRKNVNVPVHKDRTTNKKTFSGNFNSSNCKKNAEGQNLQANIILEIPESDRSGKIKKKHLIKENQKLIDENKEVIAKFHELEDLSVTKITKLKDRIAALEKVNGEISRNNRELKEHYDELLESHQILEQQLESLRVCENCEKLKEALERLSGENGVLRSTSKELHSDLDMLKTVIYRLNVQLDRYQDTLRRNNLNITLSVLEGTNPKSSDSGFFDTTRSKTLIDEVHKNHKHTPVSWGNVNSHTLGPLLDAYEDTIKEKDEIIQNYELELYNFSGKMKEILDENEQLVMRLNEDEGCSVKLRVELEKIKAELVSTKQQNDILIKKCALKQDKVEEVLKVYENRVSQLKTDLDVLHGEYMKVRTENAGLKEKSTSFVEVQEEFKKRMQEYVPLSVHSASVDECKKWYEELKQQYKSEKEKLSNTITQHLKTIEDLKNEIRDSKSAKDTLQNEISTKEKHIKKIEAKYLDLHHNLNEVQLSRTALRKQLHKAMNFAKDMVTEQETLLKALNQRQLENKVVTKIGTQIATKMDTLKSHLKDVQKNAWQEFNTVEQTIQQQTDLIETMKQEHEEKIQKLTRIIKQHEQADLFPSNDNLPMSQFMLFKEKYK